MPKWYNERQLLPFLIKSAKLVKCEEKDFLQVEENEADRKEEVRGKEIHVLSTKCSLFLTQRQCEKSTGEVRYLADLDAQSYTDVGHVVQGKLA